MKFLSVFLILFVGIFSNNCIAQETQNVHLSNKTQQTQTPIIPKHSNIKTKIHTKRVIKRKIPSKDTNILEQNIALSSNGNTLKEIITSLLPGWKIKISSEISSLVLDVVVQTSRKEAIFDILRQVKAQVIFYDAIKPQPVAVIFSN
jgi:hypothetical protein